MGAGFFVVSVIPAAQEVKAVIGLVIGTVTERKAVCSIQNLEEADRKTRDEMIGYQAG